MDISNFRVVVTPPSICKSEKLRNELLNIFPHTIFNDKKTYLNEDALVEFAKDADAILIGRDPLGEKVLNQLPNLKGVAKFGVGLDNIDQQAMENHGVAFGWTGGVNKRSVAELTLCFMLGLCHNTFSGGFALKRGQWIKDGGKELSGKTVGVIGCGQIGKEVVRLLKPFGCQIMVRDILDMAEFCQSSGATEAGFDVVITKADIISLHVPLTADTRNMIDANVLGRMKPDAFLINTSRGEVVNQEDLKNSLLGGKIAGAALDVFADEPPDDEEFLACPNLMVTPHIGGSAVEAVESMAKAAIEHLITFAKNAKVSNP